MRSSAGTEKIAIDPVRDRANSLPARVGAVTIVKIVAKTTLPIRNSGGNGGGGIGIVTNDPIPGGSADHDSSIP